MGRRNQARYLDAAVMAAIPVLVPLLLSWMVARARAMERR